MTKAVYGDKAYTSQAQRGKLAETGIAALAASAKPRRPKGFCWMIIAFLNQKGGVGKTTLAVNVAAELAARGERTTALLGKITPALTPGGRNEGSPRALDRADRGCRARSASIVFVIIVHLSQDIARL